METKVIFDIKAPTIYTADNAKWRFEVYKDNTGKLLNKNTGEVISYDYVVEETVREIYDMMTEYNVGEEAVQL